MRFSLRFMFASVAAVAIATALLLYATKGYRERLAISNHLQSIGASYVSVDADKSIVALFPQPVGSPSIARYKRIKAIELRGRITADSLSNLEGLEHIDVLLFQTCDVEDAEELLPLQDVGGIRALLFWNTGITDSSIDVIAGVPGLETVDLSNTRVTQEGVERLRAARPGVVVRSRP